MAEYIDREAAIHEFKTIGNIFVYGRELCEAIISTIDSIPAADVREVKWISVKDRLPKGGDESGEICENVCLLMDDGMVTCGWMNGITKRVYFLNSRDDFIIKAPITCVTHWMPLPPPPNCGAEKAKPIITNADRIRSMSDEELVRFIRSITTVDYDCYTRINGKIIRDELDWLKQEAKT